MLSIDLTDVVMRSIEKCDVENNFDSDQINSLRYLVDENFKKRFGESKINLEAENHFEIKVDNNEKYFAFRLFYQGIWYKLDYKTIRQNECSMTLSCDETCNPSIFHIDSICDFKQRMHEIKSAFIERTIPNGYADVEYKTIAVGPKPYFYYAEKKEDGRNCWSRLQQLNLIIDAKAYYLLQNDGEQVVQDSKLEVTEENLFEVLNNPRIKKIPYSKNMPAYNMLQLRRIFYQLKEDVSFNLEEIPNVGR